MIKRELARVIKQSVFMAIKSGRIPSFVMPKIKIDPRRARGYGDYSSPVALQIGKIAGVEPRKAAQTLQEFIMELAGNDYDP